MVAAAEVGDRVRKAAGQDEKFRHSHCAAKIRFAIESGRLLAEPRRTRLYSLEELLAQCDPKVRRGKEEQEWLDDKPVGIEFI